MPRSPLRSTLPAIAAIAAFLAPSWASADTQAPAPNPPPVAGETSAPSVPGAKPIPGEPTPSPAAPPGPGANGASPPPATPWWAGPVPPPYVVTAPPLAAAQAAPPPPPPSGHDGRFEFGSYGRVRIASDLRGGTGRQANIVSHGPRTDEESYSELEFRREDGWDHGIKSRVVTTLALLPPFFHFSGEPTQAIALRNLFAQAQIDNFSMWVGSRMYRGDDIYLLDWWPLDNQNTVGGGISLKLPPETGDTTIAAHVGMQRLDNVYQYQQIPVVAPFGFGATTVTNLDRPRVVETLKLTHLFRNSEHRHLFDSDKIGFKAILYAELHELAAGVQRDPNTNLDKSLPSDVGVLVGGELAYWTGQRDTFVQLFVRHARGVAAYDPLETPTTFANDLTTKGSTETLVAIGGNWEKDWFGILVGGYVRFFRDGDPSPTSLQKYDEGALVARPQIYIGEHWGVAVEGSLQERRLALLDAATNAPITATVAGAALMPYFSPSGRGSYKRPQLRLIYSIKARNTGARELYPAEDVFAQRKVEHFLGLGAEWWFNSSSYQ